MAILSLPVNHQELCQHHFKVPPKKFQLEVIKHIGQGEDCILIAGCGWGKSLVYFLPLALWTDRTIVVISPLLALMREQQEKLRVHLFKSICLDSSQTIDVELLRRLDKGEFRAVFMTPESILSVGKSSGRGKTPMDSLWGMSGWREKLLAIVIDETHCVSSWGKDFRKAYARLGELRDIAPVHVAFVAMSATLPGPVLQEIKLSIRFHKNVQVYNLGNNRPNVRLEVRYLPHKNIFQAFDFLLDDIQKTIIYFDSRNDSQEVRNYLRNLRSRVANDEQDIIKSFHSLYSDEYKSTILQHFREGRIKILLSTEAAGMGCDINDVVRVVQFKEPSTISCLVQRFGRAARDESMQGYAILLVSRRAIKAGGRTDMANLENNNTTTVVTSRGDPDIKRFIETKVCRRQVLNTIFCNLQTRNDNCCDLCSPGPSPAALQHSIPTTPRITAPTPAHVATAKRLILAWRHVVYRRHYMKRDPQMMEYVLMNDKTIDKLAKKCNQITGRTSLRSIINWRLHNKHDSLLAKLLIQLNEDQRRSA